MVTRVNPLAYDYAPDRTALRDTAPVTATALRYTQPDTVANRQLLAGSAVPPIPSGTAAAPTSPTPGQSWLAGVGNWFGDTANSVGDWFGDINWLDQYNDQGQQTGQGVLAPALSVLQALRGWDLMGEQMKTLRAQRRGINQNIQLADAQARNDLQQDWRRQNLLDRSSSNAQTAAEDYARTRLGG